MLSIFLGLIISIVLFVFRLAIRVSCMLMKQNLNTLIKKLSSVSSEDKLSSKYLSSRLIILSLKGALLALRLLAGVLRVLIFILTSVNIIVALVCIFLLILVIAIVVVVSSMSDLSNSGRHNNSEGSFGLSNYNYMDIDWSQDYTEKLDSIEDSFGKVDRDWCEYVILSLNTQQNLPEAGAPVVGYTIGSIVVESGGGDFMSNPSASPISGYSLKSTEGGLSNPLSANSGGTQGGDGLFQINDGSWTKFNPLYEHQASSLSPSITSNTPWYTMRYYCPTTVYGILSKYKDLSESDSLEFKDSSGLSAISHAFQLMGIEETEGKHQFIKNACLASYSYGGLVGGTVLPNGDTDSLHALATNIALLVLAYSDTYLYYDLESDSYAYTELSTNLSMSVLSKSNQNLSIGCSNSMCKSVYGSTAEGNLFISVVDNEGDFGVLDKDGNEIGRTIDGYLLSVMPETASSYLRQTASYTLDNLTSTGWVARAYYDISILIAGNYVMEKVVISMGLRTGEVSSAWVTAVEELGLWYADNINTYCSKPDNSYGWGAGRTWYVCDIFNNYTVGDDCSAYVTACLGYAGVIKGYTGGWGYGASGFKPDSGNLVITELAEAGFKYTSMSGRYVPQAGDILWKLSHVEVVGGYDKGVLYIYSWGNNFNVNATNPDKRGLPRSYTNVSAYINNSQEFNGYWRKE